MGQKIKVNWGSRSGLRTSLGSSLGWTVALPHFVLGYFAPRDFARVLQPPCLSGGAAAGTKAKGACQAQVANDVLACPPVQGLSHSK